MIIATPRVRVNRAPSKYRPPAPQPPRPRQTVCDFLTLALTSLACEECNRADDCVDEAIRVENEAVGNGMPYGEELFQIVKPVIRRCVAHCHRADDYNRVAGIIRSLRYNELREGRRSAATVVRVPNHSPRVECCGEVGTGGSQRHQVR